VHPSNPRVPRGRVGDINEALARDGNAECGAPDVIEVHRRGRSAAWGRNQKQARAVRNAAPSKISPQRTRRGAEDERECGLRTDHGWLDSVLCATLHCKRPDSSHREKIRQTGFHREGREERKEEEGKKNRVIWSLVRAVAPLPCALSVLAGNLLSHLVWTEVHTTVWVRPLGRSALQTT
jgi:hypothetical protein